MLDFLFWLIDIIDIDIIFYLLYNVIIIDRHSDYHNQNFCSL